MTASRHNYLVSAIVSTWNAERFLRGKLEDLEAQTIAPELEIIVVDCASPQNEHVIVAQFQERFPNIRYLRTARRETVYQAWNRGIRMATGEFVANANTDDRLRRDAYETLVGALREHPDCALAYPDLLITAQENATFDSHRPLGYRDWPPFDPLSLLELCCIGPFPLWRRSLHEEIGYFDERYRSAADYDFWLRAALKHPLLHVPEFLGLYWLNDGTVSRKGDLPTLEYLQVQKSHRPRFAPLVSAPRQPDSEEEDAFRELLGRAAQGCPQGVVELEGFLACARRWPEAHREAGELYLERGDSGHARRHFLKAAIMAPASARYRDGLQVFLENELLRPLEQYQAQAAADPGDLEARLCAGMCCILLERPGEALRHYRSALAIAPGSAPARGNLAALTEDAEGAASAGKDPVASPAPPPHRFAAGASRP